MEKKILIWRVWIGAIIFSSAVYIFELLTHKKAGILYGAAVLSVVLAYLFSEYINRKSNKDFGTKVGIFLGLTMLVIIVGVIISLIIASKIAEKETGLPLF